MKECVCSLSAAKNADTKQSGKEALLVSLFTVTRVSHAESYAGANTLNLVNEGRLSATIVKTSRIEDYIDESGIRNVMPLPHITYNALLPMKSLLAECLCPTES